MATPAQIEANLANAKMSSGPRTPEGKARSSMNNLRDGFRSQSVLLPGDNPAEYRALLAELQEHFTTHDLTQQRAVREMADAEWRLRRTRCQIETRYWTEFENIRTQSPDLSTSTLDLKTFDTLHQPGASYPRFLTYEAKFERQYDRAYRHWVQYQKDTARARSRELTDQVNAILATPHPEIKLPNRTDEPNPPQADTEGRPTSPSPQIVDPRVPPLGLGGQSGVSPQPVTPQPSSGDSVTFEANPAPAIAPNRTDEPNPAPVPMQNGTFEPNPAPPLPATPRARKQGTPRNAPCPCGSGQKLKRCCGRHAPPLLFPVSLAA